MKNLIIVFTLLIVGCQSKQDKMLKQLDNEELKATLITGDYMKNQDSLLQNPSLLHDSDFLHRNILLEINKKEQDHVVRSLKERIMLEK